MHWIDRDTTLYKNHFDVIGLPATFRSVLLCDFIKDLPAIIRLRNLNRADPEYDKRKKNIKAGIQGFTTGGLLTSREKGNVHVKTRSGILQLDFDYESIQDYDIDELMLALYDLPFVCFVSRSCSGDGFYALVMIEEPERLSEYAEHCFEVLNSYGIPADTTKGSNVHDLRYVSYDANMQIKDNPQPLKIKRFNAPKVIVKPQRINTYSKNNNTGLISWAVREIENAQVGQRFETVRRISYTMGGHNLGLEEIRQTILGCSQYTGVESKYLTHANEGFAAGALKPIIKC